MDTQTCRIEVNRMDGRGWRQWGNGHEFDPAMADLLIDFMRGDPEHRKLEAAGMAVPGKLFRKAPAVESVTAAHAKAARSRLLEEIAKAGATTS